MDSSVAEENRKLTSHRKHMVENALQGRAKKGPGDRAVVSALRGKSQLPRGFSCHPCEKEPPVKPKGSQTSPGILPFVDT